MPLYGWWSSNSVFLENVHWVLLLVSNSFTVTRNVITEVWQEESLFQYSFSLDMIVLLGCSNSCGMGRY